MTEREQIESYMAAYLAELATQRDLPPIRTVLPCGTVVLDYLNDTRLVLFKPAIEPIDLRAFFEQE
jgi:hypothetical protein